MKKRLSNKKHNHKSFTHENQKEGQKRHSKSFSVFLYLIIALAVILLASGFFLFFYNPSGSNQKVAASIYVSPENPKQGDTVFIRVTSLANNLTGKFNNQNLLFYKKQNSSDWISFLGIDADQKPGDYIISVDTANLEHFSKSINVSLASFSTAPTAPVPAITKNGYTQNTAIDNIREKDNPALNKIIGIPTAEPYFSGPFSFPLSKISKGGFSFGEFIGLAKSRIQHLGIDLTAPEKTPVYAVNDGKVVLTANLSNYGNTIVIDHGLGIFSLYLHLAQFNVAKGDMVKRGQGIALSGDTGYVTAPHLHFSMRVNGSRVDPIAFINATNKINDGAPVISTASIGEAFIKFFK